MIQQTSNYGYQSNYSGGVNSGYGGMGVQLSPYGGAAGGASVLAARNPIAMGCGYGGGYGVGGADSFAPLRNGLVETVTQLVCNIVRDIVSRLVDTILNPIRSFLGGAGGGLFGGTSAGADVAPMVQGGGIDALEMQGAVGAPEQEEQSFFSKALDWGKTAWDFLTEAGSGLSSITDLFSGGAGWAKQAWNFGKKIFSSIF